MRIFFVILIFITFNNLAFAQDISNALQYKLKDCIHANGMRVTANINLENNRIIFSVDNYDRNHKREVQIISTKTNKVTSEQFLGIDMINPVFHNSFDKWATIALNNSFAHFDIFPKQKKIIMYTNTLKTNDKQIKKAFKKSYGGQLINFQEPLNCLGLEIVKTNVEKPPSIDLPKDNQIIPASSGSGFFISNYGHLVTNYHVIDRCDKNIVFSNNREFEAKVISSDKINDLSILKVTYNPPSIFPISQDDVSLLEDVIVAGYPLGKNVSAAIKTHKGVVTSLAGAGDNFSNFQTDASINQGNSGGPIVNQKGNVVGVAVASWVEEGVQGVHFGIKSSTLKTFLLSNGLNLIDPNSKDLSNKDLGKLITSSTVYLECHMSVAKVKNILSESKNQKAFFSNIK